MATQYGTQYNKAYVLNPSQKIDKGEYNGKLMLHYFDYTVAAASNGDVVKLAKIPAGARVVDLELQIPDLGTAGVVNVGWAASESGGVAADADGFLASVNVNSAAQIINMREQSGAAVPGHLKQFAEEVDLQIDVATAWDVPAGSIKGYIAFVVA